MCQDAGFHVREEGLDQLTCGQTADIIGAEVMQKPGAIASGNKESAEGKHAARYLRKAVLLMFEGQIRKTATLLTHGAVCVNRSAPVANSFPAAFLLDWTMNYSDNPFCRSQQGRPEFCVCRIR